MLFIKLSIEMRDVSKSQQPERSAENSRRPQTGLHYSEKISHLEDCFSWPILQNYKQVQLKWTSYQTP